jgi:hypothetical protein
METISFDSDQEKVNWIRENASKIKRFEIDGNVVRFERMIELMPWHKKILSSTSSLKINVVLSSGGDLCRFLEEKEPEKVIRITSLSSLSEMFRKSKKLLVVDFPTFGKETYLDSLVLGSLRGINAGISVDSKSEYSESTEIPSIWLLVSSFNKCISKEHWQTWQVDPETKELVLLQ